MGPLYIQFILFPLHASLVEGLVRLVALIIQLHRADNDTWPEWEQNEVVVQASGT